MVMPIRRFIMVMILIRPMMRMLGHVLVYAGMAACLRVGVLRRKAVGNRQRRADQTDQHLANESTHDIDDNAPILEPPVIFPLDKWRSCP